MKVDRITLNNEGLGMNEIDRIYTALRVNSIGFFDMLTQTLAGLGENK